MKLCSCPRKQNNKTCILVLPIKQFYSMQKVNINFLNSLVTTWGPSDNIYQKGLARILRKIKVSSPATEHKDYSNNYLEKRALKRPNKRTQFAWNSEGYGVLWNMNNQRALSYPLLLLLVVHFRQPLMQNMMTKKERQRQDNP